MKCVMCGKGALKEKIVEYEEFGVALGKYKGSVCSACGEVFFDSETAKKIQGQFNSRKIKKAEHLFQRLA